MMHELIDQIKKNIHRYGQRLKIMEVCGTHTTAIHRGGFPSVFHEIDFLSGPGCPVCVTGGAFIDRLAGLAKTADVYTFGDMIRVPGKRTSLAEARLACGSVKIMLSPLDAVRKASSSGNPSVIAAVGFDTTAPVFALAAELCCEEKITNVSFLTELKTLEPPLRYLLAANQSIDGLILPGHVAAIIGEQGFSYVPHYRIPSAIMGFEGTDILRGLLTITNSLLAGDYRVRNEYSRVVRPQGNLKAQALVDKYYQPCDTYFRGIGTLPGAGLKLRASYASLEHPDSSGLETISQHNNGCRCGDVLMGRLKPNQCELFGAACRPDTPRGACMVSAEGSCAAYFRYRGGI